MQTIESLEPRTLLALTFDYASAFGDRETLDSANAVAVDIAGNTYFAGTFRGRIDVDRSNRNQRFLASFSDTYDAFVVKYDPEGRVLWAKKFGANGHDSIDKLVLGTNGDVYMSGQFEGIVDFNPAKAVSRLTSHGKKDAFILRLNSAGQHVFSGHIGGGRDDAITAIAVGPTGDLYYSGYVRLGGDVDLTSRTKIVENRGVDDTIIARIRGDGRGRWMRMFGENATRETVTGMSVDASGNVFLAGNFNETVQFERSSHRFDREAEGGTDIYLAKLNSNGRFQWVRTIGGNKEDVVVDMAQDVNGNLHITGNFAKSVDFDPGSGRRILAAPGDGSAFIVKLTGDAELLWARQIGPAVINNEDERGVIIARAITVDFLGNVYTTGDFVRTIDFDPGPGLSVIDIDKEGNVPTLPTQFQPSNAYVHKLDENGDFVEVEHFGGEDGTVLPRDIAVDFFDRVSVAGAFAGFVDLAPGPAEFRRSTRERRRDSSAFLVRFEP
jgi:hypothetical protein